METATVDWPRAYLLKIYQQAVAHGIIIISPITEPSAKSLRQRLYRLRRRADTSMASFILPEYHLVTVGRWTPADGGSLPVIYDRLPSSTPLPEIRPASDDEKDQIIEHGLRPNIPLADPSTLLGNLEDADLDLKPEEVDSFVDDLMRSAAERRGE